MKLDSILKCEIQDETHQSEYNKVGEQFSKNV